MMNDAALWLKLQKEFSFYKSEKIYFQNIVETYKTYDECLKKIIIDLKKDWKDLNIKWFLDYLKDSNNDFLTALSTIILKLNKWQIDIDIEQLRNILNKYPELDVLFKKLLGNSDKVTNDYLENISSDICVINVLIFYAVLKGIYEEETFDDEVEFVSNDDFYTTDTVRQYLIEIRKIPILPKEEILNIFFNIDVLNKELNNNLLDEERKKIEKKVRALKTKVIESNLRWVVKRASKFSWSGIDLMDLIQEGNQGLMKAVDYFDYQKGYNFTTYATYWIFQAIQRYINNFGRTIRLPVYVSEQLSKVNRAKKNLADRLGREPTRLEIAKELNLTVADIDNLLSCPEVNIFLDAPVKKDERSKSAMSNFIPSDENLEEEVFKGMLPEYVNDMLHKCLTKREEKIIRMRFGIPEIGKKNPLYEKEHTLQEVGDLLFVTRERIRQIEVKALKKLRTHKAKMQLQGYYSEIDNSLVQKESGGKNMFEEDLKTKRELYLEKIQLLSEEDRNYIFLRYGKDLTERNILDSKHSNRAYLALKKVKRMIDDPSYVPQKRRGGIKSKNGPIIKIIDGKRSVTYLKEKLKCTDEDIINLAFCLLANDDMDILYRFYGATLTNALNEVTLSESDYKVLEKLYGILLEKVMNLKRPVYLKDVLNVSKEDIIKFREFLSKTSVRYKFLSKVYGEDFLQEEKNIKDLSDHELNLLLISLKEVRKQIINNDFANKKSLKGEKTKIRVGGGKSLKELLVATDEEMNYLLGLFAKNSIMYKVLQKIYGENLDKEALNVVLNAQEKSGYNNALAKMRKKLKLYRDNQKLAGNLVGLENQKKNINDLDVARSEEIQKPTEIGSKNKNIGVQSDAINGVVEIITEGTYETIPTPLKHPFFKEFVNLLPLKYKLMSSLRLGLYDGNIHSIGEIAKIFNVKEDEVESNLNKGIDLFLTLVNRYQELYNLEFPNLDGELMLIKKLVKN